MYPPGLGGVVLVSIARMVVVVDEDLILTQIAEYLAIYGICENKLLYMYHTTTILHSLFNIKVLTSFCKNHFGWDGDMAVTKMCAIVCAGAELCLLCRVSMSCSLEWGNK